MTPPGFSYLSFFYLDLFHGIRFYDIVSMITLALLTLAIVWVPIRILVSLIKIITGGKPKEISVWENHLIFPLFLGPFFVLFVFESLSFTIILLLGGKSSLYNIDHFHYLFTLCAFLLGLLGLSLSEYLHSFLQALWSSFSRGTVNILMEVLIIPVVSIVCVGAVAASFLLLMQDQRKCEAIPQLGNGSDLIQRIYKKTAQSSHGYGYMRISLNGSDLIGGFYESSWEQGEDSIYHQAIMIGHDNDGIAEYGSKLEDFDNPGAILHPKWFKRIHLFAMKDRELYYFSAIYVDKKDEDPYWIIEGPIGAWGKLERPTRDTMQLMPATWLLAIGEIFGIDWMVEAGKKIQMEVIARSLREQANTTLFYNPPCE